MNTDMYSESQIRMIIDATAQFGEPERSRWGHAQVRNNGRILQICFDDNTIVIVILEDTPAMLNLGRVTLSGAAATTEMLAATLKSL